MPSSIRQSRALLPACLCIVILLISLFFSGGTAGALPYGLLILGLLGVMMITAGREKQRERSFTQAAGPITAHEIPPVRFEDVAANEEAAGRKLGFIAQEMGREINTLGSKANESNIQILVVKMKDELEKIKEQVLNIL